MVNWISGAIRARLLRNRVAASLLLAAALLLLTGAHTARTMRTYAALAEKRAGHIQIIESLSTLISLVKDVETARRGFLLTNREEYLGPHVDAVPKIHEVMHGLRLLARGGRISPTDWERAEQAVISRLQLADQSISRFRLVPEHDEAQQAIGEQGRQSMDETRAAVQALVATEQAALEAAELAVEAQERFALVTIVAGAVTSALMVLFAIATLWVQMRRRAAAEKQARDAKARLEETVEALRLRNALIMRLGELSHLLQASRDFPEALAILEERLPVIFPGTRGTLYLMRESRDHLELGAQWGGGPANPALMEPDACWSLRKGFMHVSQPTERATRCAHQAGGAGNLSLCVPLVAQGEARGVLCLEYPDAQHTGDAERDDVPACAEQIIVALSNLQLRDRLRTQAIRDPLSGLYNRRYLIETADREISRARREEGRAVSLILMDIDHFKRFNDTYGHDAGDVVIQAVAEQLRRSVRGGDIAARHGGEEFVLWMPGARKADAARRAEELREQVRHLSLAHGGTALPTITLSLGVAAFSEDGDQFEALMKAADLALYEAKHAGRDRVVLAGATPRGTGTDPG